MKKGLEYMTRKLIEEYEPRGLAMNMDKRRYMYVGDIKKNVLPFFLDHDFVWEIKFSLGLNNGLIHNNY